MENRSAFDVAFEAKRPDGTAAIVGVETKYHEHCAVQRVPSELRLARYRHVCDASGVFKAGAIEKIVGTKLQQIWLDHLLVLSMLQDASQMYSWGRFVLVHPSKNPSYAYAASSYIDLLADTSTFEVRTIESLLDAPAYPAAEAKAFRERYFWNDTVASLGRM
nr:hypothetical protein [Ideonella sp. A 288]